MVELADIFSTSGTTISFILSFTPIFPFIKIFKKEEKIDIHRRTPPYINIKSYSMGCCMDFNRT